MLAERFPGARMPSADALALLKMRTHLFRYFSGCPGAAALRARIGSLRTRAELDELLCDDSPFWYNTEACRGAQ